MRSFFFSARGANGAHVGDGSFEGIEQRVEGRVVDEAEVFIVGIFIEPFAEGFGVEFERFDAGGFVAGLGCRALLGGGAAVAFQAAAFRFYFGVVVFGIFGLGKLNEELPIGFSGDIRVEFLSVFFERRGDFRERAIEVLIIVLLGAELVSKAVGFREVGSGLFPASHRARFAMRAPGFKPGRKLALGKIGGDALDKKTGLENFDGAGFSVLDEIVQLLGGGGIVPGTEFGGLCDNGLVRPFCRGGNLGLLAHGSVVVVGLVGLVGRVGRTSGRMAASIRMADFIPAGSSGPALAMMCAQSVSSCAVFFAMRTKEILSICAKAILPLKPVKVRRGVVILLEPRYLGCYGG